MLLKIKLPQEKSQTRSISLELTEVNPDKADYIGIRDILKWKMDHKNSSSIISTSFHFHLVKWKLGPTSICFIYRFGMHFIAGAIQFTRPG